MEEIERINIFKQFYFDTWSLFLPNFKEFSFNDEDLVFELNLDMKSTIIKFQEKMFLELYKTFCNEKDCREHESSNKREVLCFLDKNQIIIKTKPSLAFSQMQYLLVTTASRLQQEKSRRVVETRKLIKEISKEFLFEKGFSEKEINESIKIFSYYDKGEYYLKISRKKKELVEGEELLKKLEKINVKINML
ncbi:hypothetical protein JXK06_00740 [Patescibacteria group bacterium]|nr:hypothetical protein [Patescibacteria group bacterium]